MSAAKRIEESENVPTAPMPADTSPRNGGAPTEHIRHRIRPRGGNSFYRDRNPRPTSTLCGAPVTDRDAVVTDRRNWKNDTNPSRCPACLALAVSQCPPRNVTPKLRLKKGEAL